MIQRRPSKVIRIGDRHIGGAFPVLIQSMTTTKTENVEATVQQINQLAAAGCEIVRVAVPNMEAAQAIAAIKKGINIPLVADIHYDHNLALKAIEGGIDKVRLNPGNISSEIKVREVVSALKDKNLPIRIGVNSGSVEKEILEKFGGHPSPRAMVESALYHVKLVEKFGYENIVVSLKSSSIFDSMEAYSMIAKEIPYPLHLGITEAGTPFKGTILSSIGIGNILLAGIGDTIRISLTGDPLNEIPVAKGILESVGLRKFGPRIVSCPTCGRCNIDLVTIAEKVEKALEGSEKDITVAIMGCSVNGPGEAREADIGIAGGIGEALLFKKGNILRKVGYDQIVDELLKEIKDL